MAVIFITKRDYKNLFIFIILIIYAYVYKTFLISKYLDSEKIITPIFLIVITFVSIKLLGIRKTPNKILSKSLKNLLLYEIAMYFVLSYGAGLIFGFLKNSYSLTAISIIKHIITPLFFIFFTEILRYVVISANKDKKYPIVAITIIIIILELFTVINTYQTNDFSGLFRLVGGALLPLSIKHYTLSYLSYNSGLTVPIIYRLFLDLYIFFVPIVPDFSESLQVIVEIIFITIVYISSFKICNERKYKEPDFKSKKFTGIDYVYIFGVIVLVALASGLFKYTLLSVGSDSMKPTFSKGDGVILNQKIKKDNIKKNDIVLFEDKNGKPIIHRVIEVKEVGNIKYYYTKGDANNVGDNIALTSEDIKAKVILIVPFIGYPNILIEECKRGL